jgi:hypothetical protein
LGENAANYDPLSELLSGDPERKYRDYAGGQNQCDELLTSAKAACTEKFSIAQASAAHLDRLG